MIVDLLHHVDAAQAETTLVIREVWVTFYPLKLAVFDVSEDTATIVASRTRPDRSSGHFITVFVPAPIGLVQVFVNLINHELSPPFHSSSY